MLVLFLLFTFEFGDFTRGAAVSVVLAGDSGRPGAQDAVRRGPSVVFMPVKVPVRQDVFAHIDGEQ